MSNIGAKLYPFAVNVGNPVAVSFDTLMESDRLDDNTSVFQSVLSIGAAITNGPYITLPTSDFPSLSGVLSR